MLLKFVIRYCIHSLHYLPFRPVIIQRVGNTKQLTSLFELNQKLTSRLPVVQVLGKHLEPGIEKSGTENLKLSIDAIQAILRADREEPAGNYRFG